MACCSEDFATGEQSAHCTGGARTQRGEGRMGQGHGGQRGGDEMLWPVGTSVSILVAALFLWFTVFFTVICDHGNGTSQAIPSCHVLSMC